MTKKYFEPQRDHHQLNTNDDLLLKQRKEFIDVEVLPDSELESELEHSFNQFKKAKPYGWKIAFASIACIFLVALVAQSVQWLFDSWQQNQWISFAFALVSLSLVILGITALIKEFIRFRKLTRLSSLQQQSEELLRSSIITDSEQGWQLCLSIAQHINVPPNDPRLQAWRKQISEAHTAQEISDLFSRHILADIDKQAQTLVSKSAVEAALVVGVSPLAVVDLFFVAWRNLALINNIAALYGMELGYFSRMRLLRMVLVNMAFAGATEWVHELGMDWLSKDIMAKLSARAAQGLGVGLLVARLGIKCMEFCRPLAFQSDEKPRLTIIYQELWQAVKSVLFSSEKRNHR